jgi:phage major head subunit gpT-like protein
MLLNAANLAGLTTGFRGNYNTGFNSAATHYMQIASVVPSTTADNKYPWLGDMPGIREWIGEREIHKLAQFDYAIKNKKWEMTIAVPADDIKDDQYGVFAPLFANMGFETARFPDELVFELLAAGFAQNAYDGQFFFDSDHPGWDATGAEVSVSNLQAGGGNPWFLMDTRRPLKPLVYQLRESFDFVARDNPTDENVFKKDEFEYGVKGRMNSGFGFWQQAFGSKAALDATNFNAAYAAMMGLKKRSGKPLGVRPNLLVCGSTNRAAALEVVKAERRADGATNINRDAVDVLVTEWLA